MHWQSCPGFELVAAAAASVSRVQQSSALVWRFCPRARKEEETLSCVVGLEEKSKAFRDVFSPLCWPGFV